MIKTITPAEMKSYESRIMSETDTTSEMLMHKAAEAVADCALSVCGSRKYILCLCGCGNNGGDGFAALRIVLTKYPESIGFCMILPGELTQDAQRELATLKASVAEMQRLKFLSFEESDTLPEADQICVIDALFGTGLSRSLRGIALDAVNLIRKLHSEGATVVSVDIPSGLNGTTGFPEGAAVCADCTVTFHRPKIGLYIGLGPDYTGKISVADIGLNPTTLGTQYEPEGFTTLQRSDLPLLLESRKRVSHKGNYGRVLLWCGSTGMAGAAALCATAALRTGAGLVTVACPESIVSIVQILCPCATCIPLPDDPEKAFGLLSDHMASCQSFGMGCGLGHSDKQRQLLRLVLQGLHRYNMPVVLDADALNMISMEETELPRRCVLTPHPAEAGRLLGCSANEITDDPIRSVRRLHEKYNASVVLKGASSLICTQGEQYLNPYGTPAMAKGGSGDVLTGILSALFAMQTAGSLHMADGLLLAAGCALHGMAGCNAEKVFSEHGVLATDLVTELGKL